MDDFKSKVIEVKAAYDLAEYLENAGISLSPNGTGRMKGLCPFHVEKTPSFVVNESFQSYRCFGCGASGDLLSFVQEYEALTFIEALRKLAEDKGIALTYEEESTVNYRALKGIVQDSAKYFRHHFKKLPEEHPAKREILERGLSLEKMAYGYAPENRQGLYNFLKKRGYKDEDILLTGVCRQWEEGGKIVDFWRGRLIFFIVDITKHPIGFSARKLNENDKGGKYINSPDSPIFNKSKALYNLYQARKPASESGEIYITEGQFDVAAFVEAGVANVVASSGTAFTEDQAMMCRRLVRDSGEIIFCFDGDEAGRKAARKVFENTPVIHSQSYAIPFASGKDPCDLRMELGDKFFVKYLQKKKVPLIAFLLENLLLEHDLETELGREAYIKEALSLLRKISSSTLRDSFLRRVAINSFTPIGLLRERLGEVEKDDWVAPKVREVEHLSDDEIENHLLNSFDNELYSLPYRILSLLVEEPSLAEKYPIDEIEKLFPKNLRSTLRGLVNQERFVAESLPYPALLNKIIEQNYFPMIHVMDLASRESQYRFILGELKEKLNSIYSEKVYRRLLETIEGGDIDSLERALTMEGDKARDFSARIGDF